MVFGFKKLEKVSYKNIFLKYLKINPFNINKKKLSSVVSKLYFINIKKKNNFDDYIQILFDLYIFPKISFKKPILIYDFPES
ncbi:hypothetical protein GJT88_00915 [Enterobacteriaceae endosymbiont of Donacia tomentosa]|uniref:hypothetical protein n=1 Tax=Enterobacteriaceae endosymbiont of Donacia tomentosa TaxID=2675787 RepID=UPI001449E9F4|nr:hypothetical protein [Enterobacteriaceae endosymbiont of Donacia tomentosa]QJC31622.1 hypothetical protein GJT88_00915 [Enterobacteriaceae endosymbiont of Donacia tomentosa]